MGAWLVNGDRPPAECAEGQGSVHIFSPPQGQQWAQFPGRDSGAQLGPMTGSASQDGAEPGPAAASVAQTFAAHSSPLWWPNTGSMDGPYPVRHKTTGSSSPGLRTGPTLLRTDRAATSAGGAVEPASDTPSPERAGSRPAGHRTQAQAQAPAAGWEEPVPTQTCSGVSAGTGLQGWTHDRATD